MKFTTGFTLSALLLSAVTLTACDKSTPTYPGAVKTTDYQSAVVPVTGSAVPVAISDANINNDVKTALLRDDDLKNVEITVVSTKGDVRLTGELDSQNQINQAILIAEGVVGVKTIKR